MPAGEALYLYQAHPNAGLVNVYAATTAPVSPGARWPGETLSAKELQGGKLLLPRAATAQPASYYVQIQSQGLHWIQAHLLSLSRHRAHLVNELPSRSKALLDLPHTIGRCFFATDDL